MKIRIESEGTQRQQEALNAIARALREIDNQPVEVVHTPPSKPRQTRKPVVKPTKRNPYLSDRDREYEKALEMWRLYAATLGKYMPVPLIDLAVQEFNREAQRLGYEM